MLLVPLIIAVVIILYCYVKWSRNYWTRRGLDTYRGHPSNLKTLMPSAYNQFKSKNLKHGGVLFYTRPVYFPVDLEIIRCIMIKNFDNFSNHNSYINMEANPLTGHLFGLRNERWKNMRHKITPTFTPGKMKMMFPTMVECTKELVNILDKNAKIGDPVDIKDVLACYTTDIIGSVGFGIECNSLKDPENEFRKYGKKIGIENWRLLLARFLPHNFLKMIGFKTIEKDVEDFFIELTKKIIKYRETNNIYRKDFMHLMLQLKNRGKIVDDEKIMEDNQPREHIKVTEIAAQLYIFFLAGFETSSILMSFALLELAQEQDIQDKLREEIQEVTKKHGGITYDAIMEMEYLDQVVNETLRIHPPGFSVDRECSKDFQLPGTDLTIKKGIDAIIPIIAIHHDPEYYPEPLKFIPERFSSENKKSRDPIMFIPFGAGPRSCIGDRFALLQSKVGLTTILKNFKANINNKTQLPVEYDENSFLLTAKGDIWLNFTRLE